MTGESTKPDWSRCETQKNEEAENGQPFLEFLNSKRASI